jgi:hypothetical protein
MWRYITDAFWRLVFFWKKRTGFVDLHTVISATGVVLSLRSSEDGDALINLFLDEDARVFTPEGIGDPMRYGLLHCEIPPWIRGRVRDVYAGLKVGDCVRVTGEWGFDGVHVLPDHWPWWTFPLEVLLALWRHQPNTRDGWFEIHSVTGIEKL